LSPDTSASQTSTDAGDDLRRLAERIFQLNLMFWALRHKNRTDDPNDLTEPEFATLDTLVGHGVCTVGTLQKALNVQPAQMSRIIRSLEAKAGKKMVECQLNPKDKRRIDVTVTAQGRKAYQDYRELRLDANMELLASLSKTEQRELIKLLDRFGALMSERLGGEK